MKNFNSLERHSMKTPVALTAIVFALVGITAASQARVKTDDEAAIRALEAQRADAMKAKDLDTIMALYAPDVFAFDFTPPRQWVGATAYRETYAGLFKEPGPITFEIKDLSITVIGDVAYSHQIQRFAGGYNGKPIEGNARCTDVYRKINGKWLIVQEHISVPADLDTGKYDLSSKL
jgi:uncharacterized protein (TIGR02246 family)